MSVPAVAAPPSVTRRRVRLSLGQHTISEYYADADLAHRYAAAMSRRYPGLQVTDEPVHIPQSKLPDLPANHLLWPLTTL